MCQAQAIAGRLEPVLERRVAHRGARRGQQAHAAQQHAQAPDGLAGDGTLVEGLHATVGVGRVKAQAPAHRLTDLVQLAVERAHLARDVVGRIAGLGHGGFQRLNGSVHLLGRHAEHRRQP